MTADEFRGIVLALPGVEEGTSYGEPAFKVAGKFLTRVRREEGGIVLKLGFFERDALLAADPDTFFLLPHYQNYPTVLAHIERIDPVVLEALLWESWRMTAPKKLQKEHGLAARPARQ